MCVKLDTDQACPCFSGKPYRLCCQPFHQGKIPLTAVELMRSRYAAYALDLVDYIIGTTHPDNPQYLMDKDAWRDSISHFSHAFQFTGLDILYSKESGDKATVTFRAHLTQNGRDATFSESSLFKRVKGHWLYRKGEQGQCFKGHDVYADS